MCGKYLAECDWSDEAKACAVYTGPPRGAALRGTVHGGERAVALLLL